ncbi:MAG: hypothetical protein ABS46_07240 [Cytophagaceae bacterium SCN 52-12]|nr:MAG: hypothetical protein ABS46_07240 [Cytophagaceae bacterium SCN 52-12]
MPQNYFRIFSKNLAAILVLSAFTGGLNAQSIALQDLSAFRSPSPNWQLAGSVRADPDVKYDLRKAAEGKTILVNLPADPKQSKDIYSVQEHGDADIEMEFMMAKESNSGIYLQGRYEIQLLDSWGKKHAAAGDCGGIYERWDESRPQGHKGYQGYAPRQNASRVAGVWQKIRISFQAPRFDKSGKKTENARILSIYLNDLLIHENVELTGPTRGGMNNDEVARGPLRFQGDHGPVAFRNIVIRPFDGPKPFFKKLGYIVHDGRVLKQEQLGSLKPVKEGKASLIDNSVSSLANNYVIRYKGKIVIPAKGKYRFSGDFRGGYGNLRVGDQVVFPFAWHRDSREVELPAGDLPFEYSYAKVNEGDKPGFGLSVSGPGIRQTVLNEAGSVGTSQASDPIGLEPDRETAIHRSFINFGGQLLPYGVSVGSISGINYSVNLANGALIRSWKGLFLNVTPMWLSRGNGTSTPMGSVLDLSDAPQVSAVGGKAAGNYLLKGYKVDDNNNPTFLYTFGGAGFQDRIVPDSSGRYLDRTVMADEKGTSFRFILARGSEITEQPGGLFLVDGQFFIRLKEGGRAAIEDKDGVKLLAVDASDRLTYSVIW